MMRKYLFTLALSLVTLISGAQIGAGQWKIHPYFISNNVSNCVDAGHRVFYLSNGSLFFYDKASQTNHNIDVTGEINDENIKQIYYDYDNSFLFIAYENCNIDIVKDDNTVVNISAIKDVVLPNTKVINDISFTNGKAYVATSFGYIVIDESNFAVTEVRNFDTNILSAAAIGQYKIMSIAGRYYYGKLTDQIETLSGHKNVSNPNGNGSIIPIGNNKFFLLTANAFYQVTYSENSDGTLSFVSTQMPGNIPTTVQRTPDGFVASNYFYYSNGPYGVKLKNFEDYYYTFDNNGDNATKHDGEGLYTMHEAGTWWVLDSSGLGSIVNGVHSNLVMPNGISITTRAYWTTYDPYQHRVLLCRTSENNVLDEYVATTVTEINSYDGNQWSNITPQFEGNASDGSGYTGNFWIVVSPNEPDTYFFCFRKIGGVAKVQNNEIIAYYNKNNGPLAERMMALRFDSKGNLWMVQTNNPNADVAVISAQNQQLNEVNASHFVTNNLGGACYMGTSASKRIVFDIGAGDTKVFSAGNYNDPLIIWKNNEDLSLKQYKVFNSFNDQDNKQFSTYGWTYVKADNDGRIWMGTVTGIISFDPQEAFNDDFRITRNKVVKSEGVPVNEALLEGTQVNCIDVDNLNRKWIGTNTNGVYLVSADGSEIIKHFDMSNSPLPTDQVYSVCCNRATNSVIVVTASGVVEYYSDMTPSADNYDNVYAYPNPVQSSFTGYVTINGLMANSNVVITDAAGNIVCETTSTGGIALWDACNANGAPVKTGIYKVYASQGRPTTTGKPLTKIAVIK